MQSIEPIAYTINGTKQAIGLSRSKIYTLIGDGQLVAVKSGKTTLITADSLRAYINRLTPAVIKKAA